MSRRTCSCLITALAAAGLIGIGLYAGSKSPGTLLEIDPAALELGDVWPDDDYQHQLTIRNVSSRSVTITKFDASCACARIEPATLILAPGNSQQINLHLNLLKLIDKPDQDRWPVSVRFRAHVEDDRTLPSWQIAGEIKSPLARLPFFGRERLRLLRNEPPKKLRYLIESAHGAEFVELVPKSSFVKCGAELAERGAVAGTLEIDASHMDEGPFLASACIMLKDAKGDPLPAIPWEVSVWVQPSVEFDPPVLLMGGQEVRVVSLRSISKEGFKIIEIDQVKGLTVRIVPSKAGHIHDQSLEIQAVPTEHAQSLAPLRILVEHETSRLKETLTLIVQRPTRMLAADDPEKPQKRW